MAETSEITQGASGTKAPAPKRSRRSGPRRSQAVGALWAAPALIMVLIFFVLWGYSALTKRLTAGAEEELG